VFFIYATISKSMEKKKNSKQNKIDTVKTQEHLAEEIDELTTELQKQNSPSRTFWSGVIRGLGTAIGATLLFGVIVTILSFVVRGTDNSLIQKVAEWMMLDTYSQ